MRKLRNKAGFSLFEMLVAVGVLVLLVTGIDAGMRAATRAYNDSLFESNSGSLAGILNTALGDVLRYGEKVLVNESHMQDANGNVLAKEDVGFVFTNYEFGVQDAYLTTGVLRDGTDREVIQFKDLMGSKPKELVNTGSYPDLEVSNFQISFQETGNYFDIHYEILDKERADRVRPIDITVRLLNPEE